MGGRQKRFQDSGDDKHRDGAGEQTDGFISGEGKGVAAAEHSGEEKARGKAKSCAAGDEDAWQFERAVGSDEAPNAERHMVLGARGGDDAHVHAVVEHEQDGSDAGDDAAHVGVEADGDVVGHDGARCLGFRGEDRVSPHLVVLDLVDHLRTKHRVHELRPRDSEEGSKECAGEEDGKGDCGVGQEAAKDSRVAFGEKVPEGCEV